MKIKLYSQKNCKYCENIKKVLEENKIDFEVLDVDDNRNEWNEITRIVGMGMTPTVKFSDEVWVPSRDFRTPEELINRLTYYKEYPLPTLTDKEKIQVLMEASKNVAMSLNNINMQISTIHQKINQLLPKPEEVKIPQPPLPPNKEEIDPNPTVPVEETTSN